MMGDSRTWANLPDCFFPRAQTECIDIHRLHPRGHVVLKVFEYEAYSSTIFLNKPVVNRVNHQGVTNATQVFNTRYMHTPMAPGTRVLLNLLGCPKIENARMVL